MGRRLIFIGLLVAGTTALTPTRPILAWMSFPQGGRFAFTSTGQKLMNWRRPGKVPPSFTVKPDRTITWDALPGWCIEAGNHKYGNEALVCQCRGTPAQQWTWVSDTRGQAMLQSDSKKLLYVVAPVALRGCDKSAAEAWKFQGPMQLLTQGPSQLLDAALSARRLAIWLIMLGALGTLSFSVKLYQRSKGCYATAVSSSSIAPGLDEGGASLAAPVTGGHRFLNSQPLKSVRTVSERRVLIPRMSPSQMVVSTKLKSNNTAYSDYLANPKLSPDEVDQLSRSVQKHLRWTHQRAEMAERLGHDVSDQEFADELRLPGGAVEYHREARRLQQDRQLLITSNLGLVYHVAKKYTNRGMTLEDLVQEGVFGLIKGVERFDPDRGCRLSTSAYEWIRASITRAIYNQATLIYVPEGMQASVRKMRKTQAAYFSDHGRAPTQDELADSMSIQLKTLENIQKAGKSLTTKTVKPTLLDQVPGPIDTLSEQFLREKLCHVFRAKLDDIEARVISLRYGLADGGPWPATHIAEALEIPTASVNKIQERALSKLQGTRDQYFNDENDNENDQYFNDENDNENDNENDQYFNDDENGEIVRITDSNFLIAGQQVHISHSLHFDERTCVYFCIQCGCIGVKSAKSLEKQCNGHPTPMGKANLKRIDKGLYPGVRPEARAFNERFRHGKVFNTHLANRLRLSIRTGQDHTP